MGTVVRAAEGPAVGVEVGAAEGADEGGGVMGTANALYMVRVGSYRSVLYVWMCICMLVSARLPHPAGRFHQPTRQWSQQ